MLNDRDDKRDDHEEGEYHFSDEDISYEAEPEPVKAATSGSPAPNLAGNVAKSKRVFISIGVFLILIYIVYKMVAPSSSVSTTDINAPLAAAQTTAPAKTKAPVAPSVPSQPVQAAAVQAAPAVQMPPVQAVQSAPPPPLPQQAQPVAQPIVAEVPAPQSAQAVAPQPTQAMQPVQMMPPATTVPVQQAAMPTTPTQSPVMMTAQPVNTMPMQPPMMPQTTSPTVTIVQSPEVNAKIATMEATNVKLMTQLQTDYSQKISDYAAQNKALQDQLQTLNARVAGMESQLNHLVQALSRQSQPSSSLGPNGPVPGRHFPPTGPEAKIAYSVQAIIPGRAWLRSDNGEAITVAEGDSIKELGRVTKIDPYDGVVEINTGNKVVSLSYGNGGE